MDKSYFIHSHFIVEFECDSHKIFETNEFHKKLNYGSLLKLFKALPFPTLTITCRPLDRRKIKLFYVSHTNLIVKKFNSKFTNVGVLVNRSNH
jgi:hypothetical protein